MRVLEKVLTPGMQNAEEADLGAEVFGISGDLQHGRRTGPKQEIVQKSRILLTQHIQFVRQREYDMEVRDVEQFPLSGVQPTLACLSLTLRAVAISAGVKGDGRVTALNTGIEMAA
jgi:hypothetical protein